MPRVGQFPIDLSQRYLVPLNFSRSISYVFEGIFVEEKESYSIFLCDVILNKLRISGFGDLLRHCLMVI